MMAAYYAVAALLWLLLAVAAFALVILLLFPGHELSGVERIVSAGVVLLLATPPAIQVTALHARMREMRANFLVVDEHGIRVRLAGHYRSLKSLPEIQETQLPWSAITDVICERRKFVYPSLVPFSYPLSVYSIVTAGAPISFTVECIPTAKRAAREIAGRLGRRSVA